MFQCEGHSRSAGSNPIFFHDNLYKILETTGAVVVRCYRAAVARLHLHLTALVQIYLRQLKGTDVFSNRVRHFARDPMITECLQLLQSLPCPLLPTVVLDGDGVGTIDTVFTLFRVARFGLLNVDRTGRASFFRLKLG
jgi:hypothetical protein